MGNLVVLSKRELKFRDFYTTHQHAVRSYCLRRVGYDQADEVTADTFLTAWQKLDVIPNGSERAWLFSVAKNHLRNSWRKKKATITLNANLNNELSVEEYDRLSAENINSDYVVEALDVLKKKDQELLRLATSEGFSYAEIAEKVGTSISVVATRVYRARQKLRMALLQQRTRLESKVLPTSIYPPDKASVVVVDNFYQNPDFVRTTALRQGYVDYVNGPDYSGIWRSTSLLRFEGNLVDNPVSGFRYAPSNLISQFESLVKEPIHTESWTTNGDGWNGSFHLKDNTWVKKESSIHHHRKVGDVFPCGWSAIVFLSPYPGKNSGITIWQDANTGHCANDDRVVFYKDKSKSKFRPYTYIENVYNRLVLIRESVWRSTGSGFGRDKKNSCLTQTFFFRNKENITNLESVA